MTLAYVNSPNHHIHEVACRTDSPAAAAAAAPHTRHDQPMQTHTWRVSPMHRPSHKSAAGRPPQEGDASSIQVLPDGHMQARTKWRVNFHLRCTAGLPRVIEKNQATTPLLLSYLKDTHTQSLRGRCTMAKLAARQTAHASPRATRRQQRTSDEPIAMPLVCAAAKLKSTHPCCMPV